MNKGHVLSIANGHTMYVHPPLLRLDRAIYLNIVYTVAQATLNCFVKDFEKFSYWASTHDQVPMWLSDVHTYDFP